jgi:hypothetical protein
MIREEDVLAALDKSRAISSLKHLLDPSSKSTDALQDVLMRMRSEVSDCATPRLVVKGASTVVLRILDYETSLCCLRLALGRQH